MYKTSCMKKAYLADVVRKHGQQIKKYGQQLPGSFDAEAIHELRVEYKKLRAFIRLLQAAGKDSSELVVPPKLKALYLAAGKVRDLQLFQQQVIDFAQAHSLSLPVFLQLLQQQLFRAKENLVKAWEALNARKTFSSLKKELPGKLEEEAINTFIHRKVASIQFILLALEKDKELHSIRKQLKDILLNIRIFDKDWGISFPVVAWRSEKRLEQTADLLGGYNDICMTLSFLNEHTLHVLPPEEKVVLLPWREKKLQEKETCRLQVVEHVHQLHLISNFEALA